MNAATTYINGLRYDPATILVNNGPVPSYKHESGEEGENGTFLVFKRKQHTVASSSSDLTYIDALAARLFPGAMVLCNSQIVDNNPKVVGLDTKPVTMMIDLPGIKNSFQVPHLTKSAVTDAVDAKVNEWRQANPKGTVAAKVKSSLFEVKSQHKLEADLGFKLASAKQNFNIDFKAVESGATREWVLKFEQVYFNVSLDTFNSPGDIISDKVTEGQLKDGAGIDNQNPLGIVHNVSYGRIVYVRFRTSNTSLDLSSKVNLIVNGASKVDSSAAADVKTLKEQVSTDVFVYGGGTSAFTQVPHIGLENVHTFISQGYDFKADQVGVPIGYSVVFMRNGGQELAVVNSTSTYVETTTERHDSSTLTIKQNGAFVNHFNVTWNELSADNDGNLTVKSKKWSHNGNDCLIGHRHTLFFGGNVRDLRIKSQGKTGIVWDRWRTNYDKAVQIRPAMTLTVSGTTLNQSASLA